LDTLLIFLVQQLQNLINYRVSYIFQNLTKFILLNKILQLYFFFIINLYYKNDCI